MKDRRKTSQGADREMMNWECNETYRSGAVGYLASAPGETLVVAVGPGSL